MGLEIIDDSDWKKPDAVRKEISRQSLKFFTERGIEPHYADCLIRYNDNYDTVEAVSYTHLDVYKRQSYACPVMQFVPQTVNFAAEQEYPKMIEYE